MSLRKALSRIKWAVLSPFLAPERARQRRRALEEAAALASELTGYPASEVGRYAEELEASPLFGRRFLFGRAGDLDAFVLYLLARCLKPRVVVETGVASGRSSTFILKALDLNGDGILHSIDLPKHFSGDEPDVIPQGDGTVEFSGYVPEGGTPGWLVPDELRGQWRLHLGPSRELLPRVLAEAAAVDLFYHDSDHSHDNMRFEFEAAWPYLRPGGVLASDDIHWNKAFEEFVAAARPLRSRSAQTLGLAVKP